MQTLAEIGKNALLLSLDELNNRRAHILGETEVVQKRLAALREQTGSGGRHLAGRGEGISNIEREVAGARSDIDLFFRWGSGDACKMCLCAAGSKRNAVLQHVVSRDHLNAGTSGDACKMCLGGAGCKLKAVLQNGVSRDQLNAGISHSHDALGGMWVGRHALHVCDHTT